MVQPRGKTDARFPDNAHLYSRIKDMDDEEARKEVWKGKIAVCFTLDESELDHSFGKEHPEPVYVSASNNTTLYVNYISL